MPAGLFKNWVNKYTFWQQYVVDLVSERLDNVITIVEEIAFKQVDKRVAERLYKLLKDKTGKIQLNYQELASDIGTSREVVSRILKDFEESGILALSRRSIKIMNIEALMNLQKNDGFVTLSHTSLKLYFILIPTIFFSTILKE